MCFRMLEEENTTFASEWKIKEDCFMKHIGTYAGENIHKYAFFLWVSSSVFFFYG